MVRIRGLRWHQGQGHTHALRMLPYHFQLKFTTYVRAFTFTSRCDFQLFESVVVMVPQCTIHVSVSHFITIKVKSSLPEPLLNVFSSRIL